MPVNGIELKEGQKWRTQDCGIVTIVKPGLNEQYPWRFIEEDQQPEEGLSITDDGKYWFDDNFPILLELIKEEPMQKKFNPKLGDKIICDNGEEFICCTLEFLRENITKIIRSDKPILGYRIEFSEWQEWDEHGKASSCSDDDYNIREVIPQNVEAAVDKKEEVKEESRYKAATTEQPLYTAEEVTEAFANALHLVWMGGRKEGIEKVKDYLEKRSNKEYQEYLRLKAIYE